MEAKILDHVTLRALNREVDQQQRSRSGTAGRQKSFRTRAGAHPPRDGFGRSVPHWQLVNGYAHDQSKKSCSESVRRTVGTVLLLRSADVDDRRRRVRFSVRHQPRTCSGATGDRRAFSGEIGGRQRYVRQRRCRLPLLQPPSAQGATAAFAPAASPKDT